MSQDDTIDACIAINATIGNTFRVPTHGRPVISFERTGMHSQVVN